MAAKKSKKKAASAPAPKKPSRRKVRDNPGMGHNITALRDEGVAFVERYLNLNAQMESDMAGYKADIGTLYEEAAGMLGIKESVISRELKRILKNKRAAEKEAEMKADEREQTELWRAAMVGTQFQLFSEGDLADAPESASEEGSSEYDASEMEEA